jgi:hypothetical protein
MEIAERPRSQNENLSLSQGIFQWQKGMEKFCLFFSAFFGISSHYSPIVGKRKSSYQSSHYEIQASCVLSIGFPKNRINIPRMPFVPLTP